MKKDILIKLNSKNGRVEILTTRLGINGENLQGNIVMEFIDEFIDGTAVLELKRNEEKYYLVMNKENNKYTLPILSSLLTETCVINFQLRITVGTGENVPVWKSNIFYLKVGEAINSTTTIPEEYESWIDIANEKLNEIDNLDLDVTKEGTTSTVTITKKDGTQKSVEIYDGSGREGGTSNYEELNNLPKINNVELKGNKSLDNLGIQDVLVSGSNIKTINGNSILGEGNLVIEGGGGGLSSVAHDETLTGAGTNNTPLGVDTTKIATKSDLNGKQDTLVSGTNIKTINNTSILGSGNIDIEGGSSTNGWEGKVVSILGDSISTFEGYVPVADGHNLTHRVRYNQANASWYFNEGGTVDDTYWKKLINSLGAKLGINDSWAGSRISNSSSTNTGDVGPDACMASVTRITNLGSNGTPDLILYYGGTNDAGTSVTVGTFNSNTTYTTDLTTKTWSDFATAYKDSIMRLQHYYPFAKIVVLLPMYCSTYYNMGNLDKYNEVIKEVCDYFGVEYIDFRRCGVNSQNLTTMLGDGIHPRVKGFNEMYKYLKNQLLSMYSNDGVENVVYTVTNTLSQNTNTDRYIKGVSAGGSYSATITGDSLAAIRVYMGGTNVTSTTYNSSTGVISISNVTGNIIVTEAEIQTYTVTTNVTGGSATGSTIIAEGGNGTVYITPNANYRLPSTITVTKPSATTYSYDATNGTVSLSNVVGNVTITVVCEEYTPETYSITTSVTNGTYTGASTITEGSTANVVVTADSGYVLPSTITVSGATSQYNNVTGSITLSNPTGNVTITVVCEEYTPETYTNLQYITSTSGDAGAIGVNNTYIITDIAVQDDDIWEVDAQSTDASYVSVLLDRDDRGGTWFGQNGGKWAVGGSGFQSTIASTTRATGTFTISDAGISGTFTDGTTTDSLSRTTTGTSQGIGYYSIGAMLAKTSATTSSSQYGFKGNIYSAKCTRNGNIIANFVPVKRDSDDKVGLLDTISDKFYSSNSVNEFTAGPVEQ